MHVTSLKASFTPPPPLEMYKTADCIFTVGYIQTEYIIMEIKQSNSTNSKGQIIMYIGPKVDGTIICGPRWKGQRPDGQKCLLQTDTFGHNLHWTKWNVD